METRRKKLASSFEQPVSEPCSITRMKVDHTSTSYTYKCNANMAVFDVKDEEVVSSLGS